MGIETSSDRDFACFGCGQWQSKSIDDICPRCQFPLSVGKELERISVDAYLLEEYVGRGFYGATYRAVNRIGKVFALKLCPVALYAAQGKDFEGEIRRYQAVGHHPNIAELLDAGTTNVSIRESSVPCHYVVMEWVRGTELSKFIKSRQFSVGEMFGITRDLVSGLARLEKENLWHNDLNANNILISEVTEDEFRTHQLESRYIAKIVDFGSAVVRQPAKIKAVNDIKFLARHINSLRTALLDKSSEMSKEDRFFLMEVEKVIARALDEDPSRSIGQATTLGDEITALYRNRPLLHDAVAISLTDPFAYLNANDFPSDAYVNLLFSNELPWLQAITSSDPQSLLITGPRGCGKTMLLKSLRLRTRLTQRSEGEPLSNIRQRVESDRLAGFFVSARISIGNHCPMTKLPEWALVEEQVSLLFNLLCTYEIVDTLAVAGAKGLVDIGASAEREVCAFISDRFGLRQATTWSTVASAIVGKEREIVDGAVSSPVLPGGVGPAFLSDLCQQLRLNVELFRDKNVVFLLDDFSLPRVPREIQEILLPTIWNSGGGYSFRVSAHSESVVLRDRKGSTYLPNREFTEVNLGSSYLGNLDHDDQLETIKRCVDDILNRRFSLTAKFRGLSLDRVLGEGKPADIGGEIRTRYIDKKLQGLKYSGWDTIIRLCSGDISYIIDVLRGILSQGIKSGRVSVTTQNRAIRNYARQQLYRLQDYSGTSCSLYGVALNFGKFSRFKLTNDLVGNERRPAEYLRIEVETDRLTETAKDALGDLLRNGVFVDGGFSSSSRGTPARRIILKKLFTPVFPTTYNNRDTWPMSSAHFADFVRDPESFLRNVLGEKGMTPEDQSRQLDMLIDPVLE